METSQLLARIIGPYMLIAGIGLFVSREKYLKLLDDLRSQALVMMGMGAFTLILGLLMLQFHNIWVLDWRVLITLIGWIGVIKGATAMIVPDAMNKIADAYKGNNTLLNMQAALALLFGAFMSYMGYFA